jgi:hypothetical protein
MNGKVRRRRRVVPSVVFCTNSFELEVKVNAIRAIKEAHSSVRRSQFLTDSLHPDIKHVQIRHIVLYATSVQVHK